MWEEAHGEAGPALSSRGALRPGRRRISGQIGHGRRHAVPESCHLKAIHPSILSATGSTGPHGTPARRP